MSLFERVTADTVGWVCAEYLYKLPEQRKRRTLRQGVVLISSTLNVFQNRWVECSSGIWIFTGTETH